MSVGIAGWVEINTVRHAQEDFWFAVICIDVVADQNYDVFGRLFGVRAEPGVRPIAAARGFPPNTSAQAKEHLDRCLGVTWVSYEEIAEPLEELCRAEYTEGWSFVLGAMSVLSRQFGATNVRLIVGFDSL